VELEAAVVELVVTVTGEAVAAPTAMRAPSPTKAAIESAAVATRDLAAA
jgi:hypothetical protein